ncbi:MAG: hypothetical protein QM756_30650 [Polyangiaceae bacterium]
MARPPDATAQPWNAIVLSRPVLAAAMVAALALIAERVPALSALRVLSPRPTEEPSAANTPALTPLGTGEAELKQVSHGEAAQSAAAIARSSASADAASDPPPKVPLESADARALGGFFRALDATRERRPARSRASCTSVIRWWRATMSRARCADCCRIASATPAMGLR